VAISVEGLSPAAQKVLSEGAPVPMKMLGAKGVVPGASPADLFTVIVGLSLSSDTQVQAAAKQTLKAPPAPLLAGALAADLQRDVVFALAEIEGLDRAHLPRLLAQKSIDEDIVCALASRADEAGGEIIATNEALLLKFPAAIEALYMNKRVRMSTSDRLVELAVRNKIELNFPAFKLAAQAIMSQLIPEASEERTFDDQHFLETEKEASLINLAEDEDVCERDDEGQEKIVQKAVPLFKQLQDASVTEKIRRAMLGNSTERLLLVRDTNRLVSEAAARSPRMTENEAAQIAASRAVADQVLRIIANNRELTRSYAVKLNLVQNPLTPLTYTARLMPHLRTTDLRLMARSKNIPGAVSKLAKQMLSRRNN
jgi:hypothetical protein